MTLGRRGPPPPQGKALSKNTMKPLQTWGEKEKEGGRGKTGRMFSNPLPEYQFRRTEIRMSKKCLCAHAHCSSIHNERATEAS